MLVLKKWKFSLIMFIALLSLLNTTKIRAAGLVELPLTRGKIIAGPKEVKGKKLGDFKQWYTGNNASISLSKNAPNGSYDVRWSIDYPTKVKALVISASLRRTNRNQRNALFASFDGGKSWINIGSNHKDWTWEPFNMTLPLYTHPADAKIHISWRFTKPYNGSIWRVALRNVEIDTADEEDLEKASKIGNLAWMLDGKIVRGPAKLKGKKLGNFSQWFGIIAKNGVFLNKNTPNGNYEVRWSADFPADAKALVISADLRKHNRNQGNTLSASCDAGKTWKEIGRNTPKGWRWEKIKADLPLPPATSDGKIIIRWNFNKPHNNKVWQLGVKNIKLSLKKEESTNK